MSRPIRPGGFEAEGEGVGIDELQSARRQQRLLLGEGIYLGLIKDAALLQPSHQAMSGRFDDPLDVGIPQGGAGKATGIAIAYSCCATIANECLRTPATFVAIIKPAIRPAGS